MPLPLLASSLHSYFLPPGIFLTDQLKQQIGLYEKMLSSCSFTLSTCKRRLGHRDIHINTCDLGIIYLMRGPMEKTAEIRAKTYLVVWLILISFPSVAYSTTLVVFHFVMLFPTLSLLLTSAFFRDKEKTMGRNYFPHLFYADPGQFVFL